MLANPDRFKRLAEDLARNIIVEWPAAPDRKAAPAPCADSDSDSADTLPFDPSANPAAPPGRWGNLELREKLGEGGFGVVYRAHDVKLGRDVALKLRRPQSEVADDEFLKEARRLASVRHPNVLVVHGAERHDGRVGLWCDFVDGESLEEHFESQKLGAEEARLLGTSLCAALAAVHRAGLVHGDVKPANVMRENGGRIVLMDFGASSLSGSEGPVTRGTPHYMAPEIFERATPDPRQDLYSVAVLLYHAVTGEHPHDAESLAELAALHAKHAAPTPLLDRRPDLPPAFVAIVERALERDPAKRFESAGAMGSALASTTERDKKIPPRLWIGLVTALAMIVAIASTMFSRPLEYVVRSEVYAVNEHGNSRLHFGDRLEKGQSIELRVKASQLFYVYVLNSDGGTDAATLLFPSPSLATENPLPADRLIVLPGPDRAGDPFQWTVDENTGSEHLIIVTSREPLPWMADLAGPSLTRRLRGFVLEAKGKAPRHIATGTSMREIMDRLPDSEVESNNTGTVHHYVFETPSD